jgi:hypothetical protein
MDDLSSLIFALLRKTPLLLVLFAGLLVALIRWKRHPRTSLLASIGLVLYIIEIFLFTIVYYLLSGVWMGSSAFSVIQVVDDFIYAGILILLISAAFSQRIPKTVINY